MGFEYICYLISAKVLLMEEKYVILAVHVTRITLHLFQFGGESHLFDML